MKSLQVLGPLDAALIDRDPPSNQTTVWALPSSFHITAMGWPNVLLKIVNGWRVEEAGGAAEASEREPKSLAFAAGVPPEPA